MERRPHYVTPGPEEALPLFAAARKPTPTPAPPAQAHSSTSKAAADGAKLFAAGLRGRVLAYIHGRGAEGATDEEVATALGLNPSTARPRRVELAARGLIVEAGTRRTKSGRQAVVWCVTAVLTSWATMGDTNARTGVRDGKA